jgi:predicted transglutaminase-like cysteine proteinase
VTEFDAVEPLLQRINRAVNAEIALVPDMPGERGEECWEFPARGEGDCEDFALEKRRRLVAEGVPSAALTMAIVHHEVQFFPHAILLAETTRGTWVLDNLHDELVCWDAVPYRYERRERPDGMWERYVVR